MVLDQKLNRTIAERVLAADELKRAEHVSSGKLSASMLGDPLQWQILKHLGVPAPLDEYVLRKFERGNQVEEWIVEQMPGLLETDKMVEYLNTVGRIDAVVDTSEWEFPRGVIPHEVKSVSNAKYRRLLAQRQADKGHRLQATLYGLAMGADWYGIDYVATDDLRVTTWLYPVSDTGEEVRDVIERFYAALRASVVPEFVPRESWQADDKYCRYPDWRNLTPIEATLKLEQEFPAAYQKLTKKVEQTL